MQFFSTFLSETNVFYNLSIEELIFRNLSDSQCGFMLLYKNEPCVVLGKNQIAIWEADLNYLLENNISLCRRISGGGTIFADLGCINISFILPKFNYNSQYVTSKVVAVLQKIFGGNGFSYTQKCDVLLFLQKISGTAFYHGKTHILHHQTLLVSSDLLKLTNSLCGLRKLEGAKLKGGFVNSREAKTTSLANHFQVQDDFLQLLKKELESEFGFLPCEEKFLNLISEKELANLITKHNSFKYLYANNFILQYKNVLLECENGIIVTNKGCTTLDFLIGKKAHDIDFKRILQNKID